jgi:hypothetical protein
MSLTLDAVPPASLSPNALLILAALDRYSFFGRSGSPKTASIAAACGESPAWVLRHGRPLTVGGQGVRYAALSSNGYCWLEPPGAALARRMRNAAAEPHLAADGIPHGSFRLRDDGTVLRWVADHLPGLPRAPLPFHSERAHHAGRWITAIRPGEFCGRYWQGMAEVNGAVPSVFQDNSPVEVGAEVVVCRRAAKPDSKPGILLAAANGSAIVRFAEHGLVAMPTNLLLTATALDGSDLTPAQQSVFNAVRRGRATIRRDGDGRVEIELAGARVLPATVQVLVDRGLVSAPSAA